jgi:hypothetical protein
MDNKSMFRVSSQMILGVAAILLGLIFLFDNMDLIDGRMYIRFWPVVRAHSVSRSPGTAAGGASSAPRSLPSEPSFS